MGMNLCHYIATHQSLLQPTPPYGDEQHGVVLSDIKITLQPTPPYGDEPESTEAAVECMQFQPTPPHGDERNTCSQLSPNA